MSSQPATSNSLRALESVLAICPLAFIAVAAALCLGGLAIGDPAPLQSPLWLIVQAAVEPSTAATPIALFMAPAIGAVVVRRRVRIRWFSLALLVAGMPVWTCGNLTVQDPQAPLEVGFNAGWISAGVVSTWLLYFGLLLVARRRQRTGGSPLPATSPTDGTTIASLAHSTSEQSSTPAKPA